MSSIPSIREKSAGSMIASAIGDALGWPYEFRSRNTARSTLTGGDFFVEWTRHAGGRYWGHEEIIRSGEYSDDTQLILAVARSLIADDWVNYFSSKELPCWLEYERGGGSALKSAAKVYKAKGFPWTGPTSTDYFSAGGNGAVMRILPHVIAYAYSRNIEQLMNDVITDSTITHGHPRAILGATCYAFALHTILQKKSVLQYGELIDIVIEGASIWGKYRLESVPASWSTIVTSPTAISYDYLGEWNNVVNNMITALRYIKDSLKKGLLVNDTAVLTELKCFAKEGGAGDVAILAALYLSSKYANNPVLGIKTAAYTIGIDTDTIASITGGLLGMLCGTAWIPFEWRSVQDYHCLRNLSEILLSENKKDATKEFTKTFMDIPKLQDSPIGKMYPVDKRELPSGKNGRVVITRWKTLFNQTIYFKQYHRHSQDEQISIFNENGVLSATSLKVSSKHSSLMLNLEAVNKLLSNPIFARITFKKTLQIIDLLLEGTKSDKEIANKLKVDSEVVLNLKHYLK